MKHIGLILVNLFLFSSCTFSQTEDTFPPEWVKNPPKSRRTIYAVGFGQSRNQTIATDKARLNAFAELAYSIGPTNISSTNITEENADTKESKKNISSVNLTLKDITIEKKAVDQDEENIFNVYVLISYKPAKNKRTKKIDHNPINKND